MRKQPKLLAVIAGALLAVGVSSAASAHDPFVEGFVTAQGYTTEGLTQVFSDGSVLQVFSDGLTRAFDADTVYVSAMPVDIPKVVVALDDAGGMHGVTVLADGSIYQRFDDGSALIFNPSTDYASVAPA